MRVRIQLGAATVKSLQSRLQHAYCKDNVRVVRRITVLMDLLGHHVPVVVVCERWLLSWAVSRWQSKRDIQKVQAQAAHGNALLAPPVV